MNLKALERRLPEWLDAYISRKWHNRLYPNFTATIYGASGANGQYSCSYIRTGAQTIEQGAVCLVPGYIPRPGDLVWLAYLDDVRVIVTAPASPPGRRDYCHIWLTNSTSQSAGSWQTVPLDNYHPGDNPSGMATLPGITISVPGLYTVHGNVTTNSPPSGETSSRIAITPAGGTLGVLIYGTATIGNSGGDTSSPANGTRPLSRGDLLSLQQFHSSGTPSMAPSDASTYLTAFRQGD